MIWTRLGVIAIVAASLSAVAGVAQAQQFTTAAEVKPILEMTKGNWVALRKYDGNDLVYFSHLMAWRCGFESVRYGINGPADTELKLEKCNTEYKQPNVILDESIPLFTKRKLGSVKTISVEVTFDDGTVQSEIIDASTILIP
jgi:hypothetical protein